MGIISYHLNTPDIIKFNSKKGKSKPLSKAARAKYLKETAASENEASNSTPMSEYEQLQKQNIARNRANFMIHKNFRALWAQNSSPIGLRH